MNTETVAGRRDAPGAMTRRAASHRASARVIGLLAALLALAGLAGHRLAYRGRVQPGVHVGEVALAGLTPGAAHEALLAAGYDPRSPVGLRAGETTWQVAPDGIGMTLDTGATVARAYAVGRGSRLATLEALVGHVRRRPVAPVVTFDPQVARGALERISDAFDVLAADAALVVDGVTVQEDEAVIGRGLNIDGALAALAGTCALGVWPVTDLPLPYSTIMPAVTDASGAAERAAGLLAGPVRLQHGMDSWTLEPPQLATLITTTASAGVVGLALLDEPFGRWARPVLEAISRTARLPRFHFDTETGALALVEGGQPARAVDLTETLAQLLAAAETPSRTATIVVRHTAPEVDETATAESLGLEELVWEETSRYVGSPPERVHNIAVAAARFDGLLVGPGSVFSFNEALGDITPEAGYQETLIIMDGTTTDGVGGGVCQVSTTLFRAALRAGLPIVERYAHGYRVAYYEQGADPGLDATVYSPSVDLKFRNDTGAWLLVGTEADGAAATLTFRLYGTRPARQVEVLPAVVGHIVPPPPARVVLDASLAPGQTRVLEHARAGASASVTRVIRQDGLEQRETFYSRYAPTGLVTAVSPADAAPAVPSTPDDAGEVPGTAVEATAPQR